jgi:hypothetical protein
MNRRGQRGLARWGIAILAGWLIATAVQAQQTHGTADDGQGGFVVIEDASTPPPPPQPVSLPVTIPAPAGTSGTPNYKPGSAVYPIPFAKSPGATASAPAATSAVAAVTAPSARATGTALPMAAATTVIKPAAPLPPAPVPTWTIKEGYSIQQQLKAMGKTVQPKPWNVLWTRKDIIAGADYTSHADFPTMCEDVIKILAANGALIHYHTYTGNNTFRVWGTGADAP